MKELKIVFRADGREELHYNGEHIYTAMYGGIEITDGRFVNFLEKAFGITVVQSYPEG